MDPALGAMQLEAMAREAGVDPEQSGARIGAFKLLAVEAAKRVASGLSVVIFPEGTRQPEGKVARFKRGGVNLAHAAGVPVVPVAILNSGRLLPRGSWHADPGVIRVRIGKPFDPGDFAEPRALADAIRDAVIAMIEERREAA